MFDGLLSLSSGNAHLLMCLPAPLSACLPARLFPVHMPARLFTCLPAHLPACLPVSVLDTSDADHRLAEVRTTMMSEVDKQMQEVGDDRVWGGGGGAWPTVPGSTLTDLRGVMMAHYVSMMHPVRRRSCPIMSRPAGCNRRRAGQGGWRQRRGSCRTRIGG